MQLLKSTRKQLRDWSWLKRMLLIIAVLAFLASSFLFLTGPGTSLRIWMAETVIITQHREWAWIFVGAEQRDEMVRKMHQFIEKNAEEKQNMGLIQHKTYKKNRTIDELIKVEDISGRLWKGKKMYVFDPKSIRVMTPVKSGEGERITSMVKRTGAVAGVNGGGFDDPEGLGNGFAALGAIISGGDIVFTDQDGSIPQHIVGFTKDGTLVIGKYNMFELRDMGISEAASFYPRVIANGKPLPISDGSRAPRTAVGQKEDGTVIFIVVDGRQAHSVGATLKEIQDIFLEDGVVNAGFLDGGASSEMVVDGELITKPSSRYGERRLPSAFLVYDHPEDVVANRVWDGIDKIDPGGSYDHPDFLKEQAELKAKQKNNPAPPPASKTEPEKTEPTKASDTGSSTTKPADTKKTPTDTKETDGAKTQTPAAGTGAGTGSKDKEPTTGKTAPGSTTQQQNGGAAQPHNNGTGTPPASGSGGASGSTAPNRPADTTQHGNGAAQQGDVPAGSGSGALPPNETNGGKSSAPGGTAPGGAAQTPGTTAPATTSPTPGTGVPPAKESVPKSADPAHTGSSTPANSNQAGGSPTTSQPVPSTQETPAAPTVPTANKTN
ncbi:hypothetical protein E1757_13560 [Paenibacillus piri]|uniref:Phosphodiester glycosidase domain-containing protein n=1 Tax=Paenibacillus piri TaxID=2547395 RepID=A0A4R5KQX9_9BACL|nr:hypothetical protein E1757_13560 [Paenibacillus piri]